MYNNTPVHQVCQKPLHRSTIVRHIRCVYSPSDGIKITIKNISCFPLLVGLFYKQPRMNYMIFIKIKIINYVPMVESNCLYYNTITIIIIFVLHCEKYYRLSKSKLITVRRSFSKQSKKSKSTEKIRETIL